MNINFSTLTAEEIFALRKKATAENDNETVKACEDAIKRGDYKITILRPDFWNGKETEAK